MTSELELTRMPEDNESRRADLDVRAISPNVAGVNGIQHAAWWRIVLVVIVIVGVLGTMYYLTAARQYEGPVAWHAVGDTWRLTLGTTGTVVDLDETGAQISVNGADAVLPAHPRTDLTSAPAKVSWTPYLTKKNGASGQVVAIDIRP
jgi:hypothetical protein